MNAFPTKPSSFVHEIQIEKIGEWTVFKFSDALQFRMEELLEKKKVEQLALEEIGELDAIAELDRIFTHVNAMMTAQNTSRILPEC